MARSPSPCLARAMSEVRLKHPNTSSDEWDRLENFLSQNGASSTTFIANFWDSGQDFTQASKFPMGSQGLLAAKTLWSICDNYAETKAINRARSHLAAKEALIAPTPTLKQGTKPLSNPGGLHTSHTVKLCAGKPSGCPVPMVEKSRHSLLCDGVWDTLIEFGKTSSWTEQLDLTPVTLPETKLLWLKRLESVSAETIANALGSMKRWRKWASDQSIDWKNPTQVNMASYLKSVATGGPTAAWAQAKSLVWLSKQLLVNLQLDSGLVTPWCTPAAGHTTGGASPLCLKATVHWEELLKAKKKSTPAFSCSPFPSPPPSGLEDWLRSSSYRLTKKKKCNNYSAHTYAPGCGLFKTVNSVMPLRLPKRNCKICSFRARTPAPQSIVHS